MAKQMNFIQRMATKIAMKAAVGSQFENQTLYSTEFVEKLMGVSSNAAGISITRESSMRIATVWGCIRFLSETIGSLPWAIYERDAQGNAHKVDHDLSEVLMVSPNSAMTSQEMREAQMVNLCLEGNSYSLINKTGNRVTSIQPLVGKVTPKIVNGEVVYQYDNDTLPSDKIWHLKGFGSDGLVGFSPVGYARQAMGLSLAAEQFGATFFKNGAKATGIVTLDSWLTDDQRKKAEKNLSEMWQGLVNAHKIQLLEGGMKYDSITMPLEDAQFLETRKFQSTEICRIYRVPPHLVADLEKATFSNIEQQSQDVIQYTLLPYFTRYEQTIQKRLFAPEDRKRFFVKFNAEGFLRADSAARAALYSVLLQNGVLSRNEARALEDRPYSDAPGMDDYTVQMNMTLIQLLEQLAGTKP